MTLVGLTLLLALFVGLPMVAAGAWLATAQRRLGSESSAGLSLCWAPLQSCFGFCFCTGCCSTPTEGLAYHCWPHRSLASSFTLLSWTGAVLGGTGQSGTTGPESGPDFLLSCPGQVTFSHYPIVSGFRRSDSPLSPSRGPRLLQLSWECCTIPAPGS